jgi:hypothetical protein
LGVRHELGEAEPPCHGYSVFFVLVAQQSNGCWLGGKFVTRQYPEFGESAEWISSRAVVCISPLAIPFGWDAKKSRHKLACTRARPLPT